MEALTALFLQVCTVSAGCAAVLVPLLLLAPRLQRRVAARSFYVLFLLLALRLTLPVELRLTRPAVTVSAPDYAVSIPAAPARPQAPVQVPAPIQSRPQPEAAPAVPEARRAVPVADLLALVWVAGGGACVLWAAGSYLLARRRLLRNGRDADPEQTALLERLAGELRLRRRVRLYRSGQVRSPMALGLFRTVIVLPERTYGAGDLELILRHELTHIRRWDVAYKAVLSLACAVHWFNPLVWLMGRAAGRNLELCCDDAVVKDLPAELRRRYGNVLLDAAAAVRPIPFSTCFSGGKKQMRDRLLNLFMTKRNSAALVAVALAAALLAGGLVACEKAGATRGPENSPAALTPENQARRTLLQDYFYENYTEDAASVVLADLTGDGLDELLVLTVDADAEDPPLGQLRRGIDFERSFSYGELAVYGEKDGAVAEFTRPGGPVSVSSSHAGWGYLYLVPRTDADGWAVLDFRPYIGQGMASYTYNVDALEYDDWMMLDHGEAYFSLDPTELMSPDNGDDATVEETQALLDRVNAWRDSGVPLLAFNEDYGGGTGGSEFACLNAAPADVFGGKLEMTAAALREQVVSAGEGVQFPLPPAAPAAPEEALDALEASVEGYPDGYVFRIPNYPGTWEVEIIGWPRVESSNLSTHFLEDETWTPGRRYSFDTEGMNFWKVTLTARVTAPDGTAAEREIRLTKGDAE